MTRVAWPAWVADAIVKLALFVFAVAVFAPTVLVYDAVSGHDERPIWWVLVLVVVLVTMLFPILRRWLTPPIRRLVLGADRATGYEVMADFVARMATTLNVDEVLPRLAEVAARSAHGTRGEVSVRLAEGREWRQVWPVPETNEPVPGSEAELRVPVQHAGDMVGAIGVSGDADTSDTDRRVLRQLAAPAGVALATVRLTFELRERARQLEEVATELEACQGRLVQARREERQRVLNRVTTRVLPLFGDVDAKLDSLSQACGPAETTNELARAREAAQAALEGLREVARGIFPNLLADSGVVVALRSWGEQQDPPVAVAVAGDASVLRAFPTVEAALYFTCIATLGSTGGEFGSASGPPPPTAPVPGPIRLIVKPAPDGEHVGFVHMSVPVGSRHPRPAARTMQLIHDRIAALGGTVATQPTPTAAHLVIELAVDPNAGPQP